MGACKRALCGWYHCKVGGAVLGGFISGMLAMYLKATNFITALVLVAVWLVAGVLFIVRGLQQLKRVYDEYGGDVECRLCGPDGCERISF